MDLKNIKISKNTVLVLLIVLVALILVVNVLHINISWPRFAQDDIKKNKVENVDKTKDSLFVFEPANAVVTNGEDFVVKVRIAPGSHKISNADLYLKYDKDKLRLDKIVESADFKQVLASKITENGTAVFSAGTDFGSNMNKEAVYVTLYFHALSEVKSSQITVDQMSGIYADDNPGINEMGKVIPMSVTISQ